MLVYGLCVLVPVNMYGDPKGLKEFEQYSMSNVQEGKTQHIIISYRRPGV
jgi:hypothetical protein